MSHRVAVDAHMVGERETGNETYTLNLIRALLDSDSENEYQVLSPHPQRLTPLLPQRDNLRILTVRPANPLLRIPVAMPLILKRQRSSLVHVNYIAPLFAPCPSVVTVHDLSFEFYPEFFSPRDRLVLSTFVPRSVRSAAKVIAVSQWTKKDLLRRYQLPEEKVVVTYEAAGEEFRPVKDAQALAAVRSKYRLGERFILTLGNLHPRKNLGRLIAAYASLRQAGRIRHQLVIAGQVGWQASPIFQQVRYLGLEGEVLFPGYIPQQDLPALYSDCDLFVFPSLYEGFGLPPLEAMACGAPVVSSRAASLPEVLGEAALFFDPYNEEDIARVIERALTPSELAAQLRARGVKHVQSFSWTKTAEKTLRVYVEVTKLHGELESKAKA